MLCLPYERERHCLDGGRHKPYNVVPSPTNQNSLFSRTETQAQAKKAYGWAVEPLGNWICIVGYLIKVGHTALFVEAVARQILSVQAAIRPEADNMREKGANASHSLSK
jgi:hypothetical protein